MINKKYRKIVGLKTKNRLLVIASTIFTLLLCSFLASAYVDENTFGADTDDSLIPQVYEYTSSQEKDKEWSEEDICKFTKGCLDDDYCYPFGYIKDGQYCGNYQKESPRGSGSMKTILGFSNQSESGKNCTYDFECKSNFCFDNKCSVNLDILIADLQEQLSDFQEKINKMEDSLDKTESENVIPVENQTSEESNIGVKKENKITGFFMRIFG